MNFELEGVAIMLKCANSLAPSGTNFQMPSFSGWVETAPRDAIKRGNETLYTQLHPAILLIGGVSASPCILHNTKTTPSWRVRHRGQSAYCRFFHIGSVGACDQMRRLPCSIWKQFSNASIFRIGQYSSSRCDKTRG